MKDREKAVGPQVQDYLLTDNDVASLAKVSASTVRYWRQTGILPFVKVGRHPRIWWSAFQTVFHMPASQVGLEQNKASDNMTPASDIRRKE